MSTIDSGAAPTKHITEGGRDDQTAFDQRLSDQPRTTHAPGREAYKAHAQLMASGGAATELLWEPRRTGLLKG
jgi:IS5 family transposase